MHMILLYASQCCYVSLCFSVLKCPKFGQQQKMTYIPDAKPKPHHEKNIKSNAFMIKRWEELPKKKKKKEQAPGV